MTGSGGKRAANRANAAKSTGPRSAAGKVRSSKNALRHGLNLPITQSVASGEVEALARCLAGGDPGRLGAARAAAEAQLDLRRIRGAENLILVKTIGDHDGSLGTAPDTLALVVSVCLAKVADQLLTLDGYDAKRCLAERQYLVPRSSNILI